MDGFAGSDSSDAKTGGVFFSSKPVIRRAMELADAVMFDSPEKRLKKPLCTDPSDEEDEDDDDDEEMEVIIFNSFLYYKKKQFYPHACFHCLQGESNRVCLLYLMQDY